jgi:hypothetical protein
MQFFRNASACVPLITALAKLLTAMAAFVAVFVELLRLFQ